eukprot:scaffold24938_cov115-Skeletonema_dohrnii-CCMP3373.AAC.3
MAPYSLSACQVVRVFCAVMRALGASPIMSLGIVFLTGYPTCARPPPTCFPKIFGRSFFELTQHTKTPWRDGLCSLRLQGNRRELISDQHVYLDPIATAQRLICGDFNVSS